MAALLNNNPSLKQWGKDEINTLSRLGNTDARSKKQSPGFVFPPSGSLGPAFGAVTAV
jgi:hypothetical protein